MSAILWYSSMSRSATVFVGSVGEAFEGVVVSGVGAPNRALHVENALQCNRAGAVAGCEFETAEREAILEEVRFNGRAARMSNREVWRACVRGIVEI